jgi:hypothetical protein
MAKNQGSICENEAAAKRFFGFVETSQNAPASVSECALFSGDRFQKRALLRRRYFRGRNLNSPGAA